MKVLLPKNAEQLFIAGPVGKLDCLLLKPAGEVKALAVLFHPNPIGGGSYTHKVIQSMARVLNQKGYLCLCPNLRGVGMSDGEHDFGISEVQDGLAAYDYLRALYPSLPCALGGFSFGTSIASHVANQREYTQLILAGAAVSRFDVIVPHADRAIIVHGEEDELISLANVLQWAGEFGVLVTVFPKTGHFFHTKLIQLQNYLAKMILDSELLS